MIKNYKANTVAAFFLLTACMLSGGVSFAQTYCNSKFGHGGYEFITNVNYAGINNSSYAGTSTGIGPDPRDLGPVDYTGSAPASVKIGIANTLSVTIRADVDEYVYVFIDWNHNGVLNDTGEVYTLAKATSSNGPHTKSVTPPAGAYIGNTRMRVMVDYEGSSPKPCRDDDSGEAEDYTVVVSSAAPPCDTATFPLSAGVVAAPVSVCFSDTVHLDITTSAAMPTAPGITYQWQSASGTSGPWTNIGPSNTASAYRAAVQGTTYYQCMVQCNGTTRLTSSPSAAVNVLHVPVVDTIVALEISRDSFSFTPVGVQDVDSFHWDFGNGETYGAPGMPGVIIHRYPDSNTYNVTLAVYNKCGMDFTKQRIYTRGGGTPPDPGLVAAYGKDAEDFRLYPNPAYGKLTVENSGGLSMQSVSLLNMMGQQLAGMATDARKAELDVSGLPAGTYFVRIRTDNGCFTRKIEILN